MYDRFYFLQASRSTSKITSFTTLALLKLQTEWPVVASVSPPSSTTPLSRTQTHKHTRTHTHTYTLRHFHHHLIRLPHILPTSTTTTSTTSSCSASSYLATKAYPNRAILTTRARARACAHTHYYIWYAGLRCNMFTRMSTQPTRTGPTTAGRMDAYVDTFMEQGGSLITLAKGNRSKAVRDSCAILSRHCCAKFLAASCHRAHSPHNYTLTACLYSHTHTFNPHCPLYMRALLLLCATTPSQPSRRMVWRVRVASGSHISRYMAWCTHVPARVRNGVCDSNTFKHSHRAGHQRLQQARWILPWVRYGVSPFLYRHGSLSLSHTHTHYGDTHTAQCSTCVCVCLCLCLCVRGLNGRCVLRFRVLLQPMPTLYAQGCDLS